MTYMDFLDEWPEHRHVVKRGEMGLDQINEGAGKVNAFLSAVRQQLKAFSKGVPGSAIEKLLAAASGRMTKLVAATHRYEETYYKEILERPGIKAAGSIKFNRITDNKRCKYFSGDIAELPESISDVVPPFVRQLVHAGIGEAEYCLELFYERGRKRRSWNIGQGEILLAATEFNMGPSRLLLADTEGIPYFVESGPYTMLLNIDYVLESLECGPPLNQRRAVPILVLSAKLDFVRIWSSQCV